MRKRHNTKPIKAPKRKPKPAPPYVVGMFARDVVAVRAVAVLRRTLRGMRWDKRHSWKTEAPTSPVFAGLNGFLKRNPQLRVCVRCGVLGHIDNQGRTIAGEEDFKP